MKFLKLYLWVSLLLACSKSFRANHDYVSIASAYFDQDIGLYFTELEFIARDSSSMFMFNAVDSNVVCYTGIHYYSGSESVQSHSDDYACTMRMVTKGDKLKLISGASIEGLDSLKLFFEHPKRFESWSYTLKKTKEPGVYRLMESK